jgi:uncharacterized protein
LAKLVLLVFAGFVVYFILKNRHAVGDRRGESNSSAETMVRCARCGIHHPRSESFLAGGNFYCSREHARIERAGE